MTSVHFLKLGFQIWKTDGRAQKMNKLCLPIYEMVKAVF